MIRNPANLRLRPSKSHPVAIYTDSPLNLETLAVWLVLTMAAMGVMLLLLRFVMVGPAHAEWISSDGSTITSTDTRDSTTIVNSPPPAKNVTIPNPTPPPLPANMPALIINGTGNWPPPPATSPPPAAPPVRR